MRTRTYLTAVLTAMLIVGAQVPAGAGHEVPAAAVTATGELHQGASSCGTDWTGSLTHFRLHSNTYVDAEWGPLELDVCGTLVTDPLVIGCDAGRGIDGVGTLESPTRRYEVRNLEWGPTVDMLTSHQAILTADIEELDAADNPTGRVSELTAELSVQSGCGNLNNAILMGARTHT